MINNKIDKNEIIFTSYRNNKLKANTFVLSFQAGGKIEYDYETNFAFKSNTRIQYLDVLTDESSWALDSANHQIILTIKGGYSSLEDFKFKRNYAVERLQDAFILRQISEEFYDDLKLKAKLEKTKFAQVKRKVAIATKKQITREKYKTVEVIEKIDSVVQKGPNVQADLAILPKIDESPNAKNELKLEVNTQNFAESKPVENKLTPVIAVDYVALTKDLLDKSKRWMLVKNKIERNDIFLTTYNESKLTINNLIMSFDSEGKIAYDYESDPKVKFCAGVDFLDIDTDETSWEYNAEKNIVTLTLKGGYASLDDFKFKREYWVEAIEDGYILRKQKEIYFTDFRKPIKKEKKLSH
ncbi:hypothetical protein [Emticicia sp. SJ17W-69]|uniref:hypothetical protein n=1 Tax=Emticicia sp. SJ17W-69 TaxID=3421657 RepID=UPI003EBA9AB9